MYEPVNIFRDDRRGRLHPFLRNPPWRLFPLPLVYDLFLLLGKVRLVYEDDLPFPPCALASRLGNAVAQSVRRRGAFFKHRLDGHPVLVPDPRDDQLKRFDLRGLPFDLSHLLGVDEHPLHLGHLVYPPYDAQKARRSPPARARVVREDGQIPRSERDEGIGRIGEGYDHPPEFHWPDR